MHHAERREKNPSVTVGVRATEVIQLDTIVATPDGHFVFEGSLGHALALAVFEEVCRGRRVRREATWRDHLFHIGFGVFLRHDVNCCGELPVTTDGYSL